MFNLIMTVKELESLNYKDALESYINNQCYYSYCKNKTVDLYRWSPSLACFSVCSEHLYSEAFTPTKLSEKEIFYLKCCITY